MITHTKGSDLFLSMPGWDDARLVVAWRVGRDRAGGPPQSADVAPVSSEHFELIRYRARFATGRAVARASNPPFRHKTD
jgi:hypothetical protein